MARTLYRGVVTPNPTVAPARLIASVAVITALVGFFFTAQVVANYSPLVGFNTEHQAGDLSLWVRQAEALTHEHSDHSHDDEDGDESADESNAGAEDPTFAMAPGMTPGTPEDGFQRVQIELDFLNRGVRVVSTGPPDFYLEADDGMTWAAMRGGTFGVTSLRPLEVLSTVLAFDISDDVSLSELELVWVTEEEEIHFVVGEESDEGHSHG